jgi:hypothetical protein
MITDKNTGGPAFPIEVNSEMTCLGMTLRDYFAAKAMQGFCSTLTGVTNGTLPRWEILAMDAYTLADAMIKAREARDD